MLKRHKSKPLGSRSMKFYACKKFSDSPGDMKGCQRLLKDLYGKFELQQKLACCLATQPGRPYGIRDFWVGKRHEVQLTRSHNASHGNFGTRPCHLLQSVLHFKGRTWLDTKL